MKSTAFLGLRTAIYFVPDLARAKEWYRALLEVDPYYDSPYYVGFNVAGFELGLHPSLPDPRRLTALFSKPNLARTLRYDAVERP